MHVCLFCWFLLAVWQPRSLVLPQPSVPASRANKTMTFLHCFFVKRLAYFAQNIHFNGCNFTLAPILLDIQVFPCTYKVHVYFLMATCSPEFCSYHLYVQRNVGTYKQLPCTYNCTCILFPMATCSTE